MGGDTLTLTGPGITTNADASISSKILGSGGLNKSGSGQLTVSGVAAYTGATSIAAGTLALINNANTISNTITVQAGAILQAGSASVPTGNSSALGTATVALNGGTLRLQGVTPVGTGLSGQYYNLTPTIVANADPDFATLTTLTTLLQNQTPAVTAPTTTGGATKIDFSNGGTYGTGQAFSTQGFTSISNFIVRYSGEINITTPGVTTFYTTSDDGSMLFVDGQTVVSNNAIQPAATRTGSINLTAGLHDITVAYYQVSGGLGVQAGYTPVGGVSQVLSNSVLGTAARRRMGIT